MAYEIRIKGKEQVLLEFAFYKDVISSGYRIAKVWGVDTGGTVGELEEIHVELERVEDKTKKEQE